MGTKNHILVTGATGFVGLEVAKQLSKQGRYPTLLVRRPLRAALLTSLNAKVLQGDLDSADSLRRSCEGVDTVIHLGARAIFEEYDLVKPTIVDGSVRLMEAAIEAGAKRFIYASSMLVYDSQTKPIDQDTPTHPRCGYGEAKVESERILKKMAREAGIKLGVIRLPHVYGARDLMFGDVRKGRVFYPGNGRNIFAHMHIYDAARVLITAAEKGWEGTSVVADYEPVNWIDYLQEIKKYYPRFKTYSVPEWLALGFTWLIYPIRRLSSDPSVYTPGSVISWNLNLPVKRGILWDELGIEPKYPSIYEGIPEVLDSCVPFQWVHSIQDRI
ncbi:MAG: NAD(P)-dependent oxidoreductase [Chlamydiota bacterium]